MDLVAGAQRVIMSAFSNQKRRSKGDARVQSTSYGNHCVDHLPTDYAWFDFIWDENGNRTMILSEIAEDLR